ncbi:MAG: DUF2782 domain-containing protein [Mariprofundales bacterium]
MIYRLLLPLLLLATPAITLAADDAPLPPPTPSSNIQQATAHEKSTANSARHRPSDKQLNANDAANQASSGINIRSYSRKDGTHISEYSRHGRVYMIKVKPAGALPAYYLYDNNGNGEFSRRPGGYKPLSPPQWILKEF